MAKPTPRKISPEELVKIEAWSAVRVPMGHMAALLGMSKEWLEDKIKTDDALRYAIEAGRAKASTNVRQTLYQTAMGYDAYTIPAVRDATGQVVSPARTVPAKAPDFQAMKFWCQTQEDFKVTDVLDVHGIGASAKEQLTDDELDRRTKAALARINARKNGKR